MKILILVALIAIAAADPLSELNEDQKEWIKICLEDLGMKIEDVLMLRSKEKLDSVSAPAKEFLLCYVEENGMFIDGKPIRDVIIKELTSGGYNHVNDDLDTCTLDETHIYDSEELFDLYKCYMETAEPPVLNK